MNPNEKRQLTELWEDRHTHDGDTVQEQITIIHNEIERHGDQIAAGSPGAHIHLTAASQTVDGGAIEWTGFHTIPPFAFEVETPVDSVLIPKHGYYDAGIQLGWETFQGGGSVVVTRVRGDSELVLWPPSEPGNWASAAAREFEATAKGLPLKPGDGVKVYLDAGSAQTLAYASLVLELVDRSTGPLTVSDGEDGGLFIFTESDTFDWDAAGQPSTLSDVWIIGGGGAGAKGSNVTPAWKPGGGGAGGLLHLEDYVVSGDVAVVVGAGGTPAVGSGNDLVLGGQGQNSSFDGQVALGGGRGGVGATHSQGSPGGCGGGASTAGAVTSGEGGAGSQGGDGGNAPSSGNAGGGGGGITQNGSNGASDTGGGGGDGLDLSSVVGTDYGEDGVFGGGGVGHGPSGSGTPGDGGGGAANTDGLVNSGGGGGGGFTRGGRGGKGIVIVKVS